MKAEEEGAVETATAKAKQPKTEAATAFIKNEIKTTTKESLVMVTSVVVVSAVAVVIAVGGTAILVFTVLLTHKF